MPPKTTTLSTTITRLVAIIALAGMTTLVLTGCSANPRNELYYKTSQSRTGLVNDHYQVVSQIEEKDGEVISQNDNLQKAAIFTQRGDVIKGQNEKGDFFFYKIDMNAWRKDISQSDFLTKLPNYEQLLDDFLEDVEEMYIGSTARVVSLERQNDGSTSTVNASAEIGKTYPKNFRIYQDPEKITFYGTDINKPAFIFNLNKAAPLALTEGTQFKSVFVSKTPASVLLVNEPRSVFRMYDPRKEMGFAYWTTIVIEDSLYFLEDGKSKHVTLDEDYVVKTSFMMPSSNFICADLTQAYYDVRVQQGIEIASNVVLGIIQAYTSYNTTTINGNGYTYNNTGASNGTYQFNGRATTYDYSYVGDRAAGLLNAAIGGETSIAAINREMNKYNCIEP